MKRKKGRATPVRIPAGNTALPMLHGGCLAYGGWEAALAVGMLAPTCPPGLRWERWQWR